MTVNLSVLTAKNSLSLQQCLGFLSTFIGEEKATAILYSPQQCMLAAFEGGELRGSAGEIVDVSKVFEARVFSHGAELRWLVDAGYEPRQHAVILLERPLSSEFSDWSSESPTVIETLQQTYLLWGAGTGNALGERWSELATARIGKLPVPVAGIQQHQRVLLSSVEYIVADPDHGNAIVYDERFVEMDEESRIKSRLPGKELIDG